MRIVHVRLAASTASTRVRRSAVTCQHTKAQPGVTHKVTSPTHTASVVAPERGDDDAFTAPARPTAAVVADHPAPLRRGAATTG